MPYSLTGVVAAGVVVGEFVAAALLVPLMTRTVGAGLAAVLLVGFLVALLAAWRRGQAIDCGCFGGRRGERVGPATVFRTGALLLLCPAAVSWSHYLRPFDLLVSLLLLSIVFLAAEVVRLLTELQDAAHSMEAVLLGAFNDAQATYPRVIAGMAG